MDIKLVICEPCKGLDKCTTYCPIRAGENIVNFVNEVLQKSTETRIGEIRQDRINGKQESVVVIGMIQDSKTSQADIMIQMPKNGIILRNKFNDFWGISSTQMLKSYLNYIEKDKTIQMKAIEDLKRFNSTKVMPLTVQLGDDIEVNINENGKNFRELSKVKVLKWKIDKDTSQLKGYIYVESKRSMTSALALDITDYGVTWTLPNIERNIKTADICREAIKMNEYGLIHPIEVIGSDCSIVLDSQHMYHVKNDVATIIGDWSEGIIVDNQKLPKGILSCPAYNKMMNLSKFASKHRKYIIPYGLSSTTKINI